MQWFILSREMNIVCMPSTDIPDTLPIDDSGTGGQYISLVNNVVVGTYDFETDPYHPDSKWIIEGNYIAFKDKYDKYRLYTIMTIDGDSTWSVHCEDIGLDIINEMAEAWDYTGNPQTIAQYLSRVLGDTGWALGVNEIPDNSRASVYESDTDTWLTRIGSLMKLFDVECDFTIEMNASKVTSQLLNVYKKIGSESPIERFIDEINLKSISKSGSINDVYTCILPYGAIVNEKKTNISSINYDDGDYFSPSGDHRIYSRSAHTKWARFNVWYDTEENTANRGLGYINYHWTYETESPQELFNRALAELKKHVDVQLEWEVNLLEINADIGDTVQIVDTSKAQPVYLSARVQEVHNHYSVSGEDTGTLANYEILTPSRATELQELADKIKSEVVSVRSSEVSYQISESGTEPPNEEWLDYIPPTPTGYFLWTRSIIVYTDNSRTVSYSVSKNGDKGEIGSPSYTWIKYANSATGVGMSDSPEGKTYMGIASNKDSPDKSDNPLDYTWSLIKGEDAPPRYTWVKYAEDATGKNMSNDPVGMSYIGMAYNKLTEEESDDPSDYTWSLIKGEPGTGSTWYTGDKITGQSKDPTVFTNSEIEMANTDDLYLNTETGDTYKCIDGGDPEIATWIYISNIKGEGAINPWFGLETASISCNSQRLVSTNTRITIPFALFLGNELVDCVISARNLPSGVSIYSNTPSTGGNTGELVILINVLADLGGITEPFDNAFFDLYLEGMNKTFTTRFGISKSIQGKDAEEPLTEVKFYSLDQSAEMLDPNETYSPVITTIVGATKQNGIATPSNPSPIINVEGEIITRNEEDNKHSSATIPVLADGDVYNGGNRVTRKTRILQLTGNETWIADGANGYNRYRTPLPDAEASTLRTRCRSNYFHFLPAGDEDGGCYIINNQLYLYKQDSTTLAQFTQWIANTRPVIQYKLENETIELLPEYIVNPLMTLTLYSPKTVIYLESEIGAFAGMYYTKYKGDSSMIISMTEPEDLNKLWCDISVDPPVIRRYNYDDNTWEIVNDYAEDLNNAINQVTNEYEISISKLNDMLQSSITEIQKITDENGDRIEALNTTVQQNASGLEIVTSQVTNVIDEITGLATKEDISKWARFEDGVLTLGVSNSQFSMKLSNEELGFYESGTRIAYINNQQLYVNKGIFLESINLGNFIIEASPTSGLSIK